MTFGTLSSPGIKRGRLGKIRGPHWSLPEQTQPTAVLHRAFLVLSFCPWKSLEKTLLSSCHQFPFFYTQFFSFIHSLYQMSQSLHFSVLNDTEDSIKLKELLPLIPVMSSWMCYNDITQSLLTQNKISQIQSINTSSMKQSHKMPDIIKPCAFRSLFY